MKILWVIDSIARWFGKRVKDIREWVLIRECSVLVGRRPSLGWRKREGLPSHNNWPKNKKGGAALLVGAVKGLRSESFPEIRGSGENDEQ